MDQSRRQMQDNDVFDIAIVGGGLAGGMAALQLAKANLKCVIFEKDRMAHHKVCGEFLSGESLPLLKSVGVDPFALGGTPLHGFRLHGHKETFSAALPIPAVGLSRFVLDEAILGQAERAGAFLRRGVVAREVLDGLADNEMISLSTISAEGEAEIKAKRLIVASGTSEFKGVERRPGRDSGMVGFKMHLRLKPSSLKRLGANFDLFVFEHGYGGIVPIENGQVNFCFLIEKKALARIGSDWPSLAAHIARYNMKVSHYLDGSEALFKRPVAQASIPFGFLRRVPPESGVFCAGDQMATIPSLTGDGMTIALMTGKLAADLIADAAMPGHLKDAKLSRVYQNRARRGLRSQVEVGYYVHRMFKSPEVVDWSIRALERVPGLFNFVFSLTRCDLVSSARSSNSLTSTRRILQSLNLLEKSK